MAGEVAHLARYPAEGRFVEDIETGLVAQFQEAGRVVVVAGANGVDVGGLHELDVGLPDLFGKGVAQSQEFIVAARAGEFDGHAVDQHHAALQLDRAETDAVLHALHGLFPIRQVVEHVIQVRLLGRPELGRGDQRGDEHGSEAVGADDSGTVQGGERNLGAGEGIQFARKVEVRTGRPGDADSGPQGGVFVLSVQVRDHRHIIHVQGRKGEEVVLAVDAAQTPEIALVQADRGGLLVHADGHEIALAGLDGLGDVDVKGREAAFMVAGAVAVDEDFGAIVNAVEMPEDALAGERGRNLDPAAIQADVFGLVAGAFLVRGDGEAFDFPIGGDGDVLPVGVGGGGVGEIGNGGRGRQLAVDRGADAVIEFEAPRPGHGEDGGIADAQAGDGDRRRAGDGHGGREGPR